MKLDSNAFKNTAITKLIFPESISTIGSSAFENCTSLSEVTLPKSLTLIDSNVFSTCTALKTITFGNALNTIKSYAFYKCSSLTSIIIPESISSIETGAFMNCSGLQSVTVNSLLPIDFSSYNYNVFNGVDKTVCTLNVPYQSKSLYAFADQWKDFVNTVENPNGLMLDLKRTRLSFMNGSNIGVNVTSNVDWKAVSNQSWLSINSASGVGNKLITLTAEENISVTPRTATVTVTVVGVPDQTVFVTQAAGAKTVQVTAGNLSNLISSNELSTISNLILTGTLDARDFKTMRDKMPLLEDLNLKGTSILEYTGTEGTSGSYLYTYKASTIPEYAFCNLFTSIPLPSLVSVVLPASVNSIGSNAFRNCSSLTTIKLPETLLSVGDYAFQNCIGLLEISLPNSLRTIGTYSFSTCKALNVLNFGNSLISIDSDAFEYCSALKSVVLPNSISTLGAYTFNYCTSLTDFNFGNSLKSTGYSTLSYCKGLKNVILPNSLSTIDWYTFNSCSKLETIIIPNTVTLIDFRSFMSCTSLKNINLSNSLLTIGSEAFYSCEAITEITIPNKVTTIEDGAFDGCNLLRNIVFGNSISSVGSNSFGSCNALVSVVLPASLRTIKSYAFINCYNLKTISIPAGVNDYGDYSLSCSGLSSIYVYAPIPYPFSSSSNVFSYVNKSSCTLYVLKGSKTAYQIANIWKDFTNIVEMGTTEESSLLDLKLSVYPNPAQFGFRITGLSETGQLFVNDLAGRVVLAKKIVNDEYISTENLSKGIYILRVITAEGRANQKLIIE